MRKLSPGLIERLESKGLVLFGKESEVVRVGKPLIAQGNCVEGKIWKPISELQNLDGVLTPVANPFETNAPILGIFIEEEGYRVQVWQWVPGPGPGDFEVLVTTENEVYRQTIHYFFEPNEHFEAYRIHQLKSSNT